MFKLRVSQYINNGLVENNWTYKTLCDRSGVPVSTIHSYAQGKTSNPNEENLIRIAAAFGDPPSVIHAMRKESVDTTAKENILIAKADDKELMEKHAALIRESVTQILDEYRAQALEQQIETSRHADERVKLAEQKAEARVFEVEQKTAQLIEAAEQECEQRIKIVLEQCEEHEKMHKQHCTELIEAERRGFSDSYNIENSTIAYLRSLVRNLTIALIGVSFFSVFLCVYSFLH